MKLVTFNIRYDSKKDGINDIHNRIPLIAETICRERPELICFQEIEPPVKKILQKELPGYLFVGLGRNQDYSGEGTNLCFDTERLTLFNLRQFWLSETPEIPGSQFALQGGLPRICTTAVFYDESGKLFRIYNTHLDHKHSSIREKSLALLLTIIKRDNEKLPLPTILTGDFNAVPESPEMDGMCRQTVLRDITADIPDTFHGFNMGVDHTKIDYIYVSKELFCSKAETWHTEKEGIFLSDHDPICVNLQW